MNRVGQTPPAQRIAASTDGSVPDVRISKVARGLDVKVETGYFSSRFVVSGEARGFGDALRMSYNGKEITIEGRGLSGAKTALLVGQELQAALEGATQAYVTGKGELGKYEISVVHI